MDCAPTLENRQQRSHQILQRFVLSIVNPSIICRPGQVKEKGVHAQQSYVDDLASSLPTSHHCFTLARPTQTKQTNKQTRAHTDTQTHRHTQTQWLIPELMLLRCWLLTHSSSDKTRKPRKQGMGQHRSVRVCACMCVCMCVCVERTNACVHPPPP